MKLTAVTHFGQCGVFGWHSTGAGAFASCREERRHSCRPVRVAAHGQPGNWATRLSLRRIPSSSPGSEVLRDGFLNHPVHDLPVIRGGGRGFIGLSDEVEGAGVNGALVNFGRGGTARQRQGGSGQYKECGFHHVYRPILPDLTEGVNRQTRPARRLLFQHGTDPCLVVQIPSDRLTDPLLELVGREPAQLILDLGGINGI